MDESFEKLVSFAQKEPHCFRSLSSQEVELAERVMGELVRRDMPMNDVVERIVHSRFKNNLLLFVLNNVEDPAQRAQLIDSLMMEIRLQGVGETVGNCLSVSDELPSILTNYAHLIADPDHYLYGRLSIDQYWAHRVRRHLLKPKPDTERAYDELRKAWKGFRELEEEVARKLDRDNFRLETHISNTCLERLVAEIYEAVGPELSIDRRFNLMEFLRSVRPTAYAFASRLARISAAQVIMLDCVFQKLRKKRQRERERKAETRTIRA